ncbi:Tn3 family transposase [Geitlerinema splendidum]|nr:Tn3 family transposase [Geitlerinema splendidum]
MLELRYRICSFPTVQVIRTFISDTYVRQAATPTESGEDRESESPQGDEILNNETELLVLYHTTEIAGYTEVVFAVFDRLGLRFSPRIRDRDEELKYI